MGIEPRVEMAFPDEAEIARYRDLGVKHFCCGPDVQVMYKYFQEEGAKFNSAMGRPAPALEGYGHARPGVPLKSTYGDAAPAKL